MNDGYLTSSSSILRQRGPSRGCKAPGNTVTDTRHPQAYTADSADVPAGEWMDTDPLAIEASKSQQVKMRSFSTDVHRIEAMVLFPFNHIIVR